VIAGAVLRSRVRMLRNAIAATPHARRRASGRFGRNLIAIAFFVVVLGSSVGGLLAVTFKMVGEEPGGIDLAAAVLGMVLSATLVGLLALDLHEAIQTLITDSDLDLLRRAPIAPAELFAIKLGDALPKTSLLFAVVAVPAVAAFHWAFSLPWWTWLMTPILMLALWAIPMGVGTAAAFLVLRVIPARFVREALGLLSGLTFLFLWLLNFVVLPRTSASILDPGSSFRHAAETFPHRFGFSPGWWTASALASADRGISGHVVLLALAVLAVAAISLTVAARSAEANLETVRSRVLVGSARVRRAVAAQPTPTSGRPRSILSAVLARDARSLARSWTVLSDLVTAAVLWTLLPFISAPAFNAGTDKIVRAMLLALPVGLGYEIAARAIPLERHGYQWVRLAPVRALEWILAKFAGCLVVALVLLAIVATSAIIALKVPRSDVLPTMCLAVPALVLALGTGLWLGARFGDRDWTNPRAMLTPIGRAVSLALLIAQAGLWFGFVGIEELFRASLPPGTRLWLPTLVTAALLPIPIYAAAARMSSRE
jgi:ABC-2 type transport system permease protein